MNRLQTFQQFLTTQSFQIPVWGFLLNLILSAVLAFVLSRVYVSFGTSLSNRSMFARNFMVITMTTMLIISIVKSSLALSLGLVGALSIVRFRAAIKEPEELSYLFLAIAVGLGFGAGQRLITLVAFVVIVTLIILRSYSRRGEENQNMLLTISSHNPDKVLLEEIVKRVNEHCSSVRLKRFDETKEMNEASFLIECDNVDQLRQIKSELQNLHDSVKVTYLDNKGIF